MGSAPNPIIAGPMLRKAQPDAMLLDIEMPDMDGLTFLRQLMTEQPIPTVICSSLSTEGSRVAVDTLAAGAPWERRRGRRQFAAPLPHWPAAPTAPGRCMRWR